MFECTCRSGSWSREALFLWKLLIQMFRTSLVWKARRTTMVWETEETRTTSCNNIPLSGEHPSRRRRHAQSMQKPVKPRLGLTYSSDKQKASGTTKPHSGSYVEVLVVWSLSVNAVSCISPQVFWSQVFCYEENQRANACRGCNSDILFHQLMRMLHARAERLLQEI